MCVRVCMCVCVCVCACVRVCVCVCVCVMRELRIAHLLGITPANPSNRNSPPTHNTLLTILTRLFWGDPSGYSQPPPPSPEKSQHSSSLTLSLSHRAHTGDGDADDGIAHPPLCGPRAQRCERPQAHPDGRAPRPLLNDGSHLALIGSGTTPNPTPNPSPDSTIRLPIQFPILNPNPNSSPNSESKPRFMSQFNSQF